MNRDECLLLILLSLNCGDSYYMAQRVEEAQKQYNQLIKTGMDLEKVNLFKHACSCQLPKTSSS